MQPAYLDEEHLARIKVLMKNNPKIVIENHIRDFLICYNFFTYGTGVQIFEQMLNNALIKVERKLKYNKRKV